MRRAVGSFLGRFAALALAGGALAAVWSTPASGSAARPQVRTADVTATFQRDCAVCHGADGAGTNRGPSLLRVGRASTDYMLSTGRMPIKDPDEKTERHAPKYPPAMIRGLVDHVEALGPGGPDIPDVDTAAGDLPDGGELFRLQCAACHAWAGDGGALLHREAPDLHRSTPTQIAEAVRVGPGTMPAFGDAALTDEQLNSVAAYVRYLADPKDRGGQPLWHLGPLAEGGVAWVVGIGALILAVRWIGET